MSSSKTILITRSHDDGHELHERLHAAGYRAIHEPLTQVVLNHTARLPLAQVLAQEPDAILITSRNGARALATLTEMREDLQSSISYSGGKELMDLRKVNYVILGGNNAGEHLFM